ncbi:hypothetical protein TNCV_3412641 [Trichonephila clavipes]|uniref:Uncharacterized protein n=1 Tax=Trichonephila clavipes TaxID=2585209 RepID=A0A8X6UV44_TRICX|nr:hypothetical protein TNCV_3412641 [Trichonephila clavipes]
MWSKTVPSYDNEKELRVSLNAVYKLGGVVENIVRSQNYIGKHGRKRNPNEIKRHKDSNATTQNVLQNALLNKKPIINKKYDVKASEEVFEIATIGMYARTAPTRHGLPNIFENTRHFTDPSSSDGYPCDLVHFGNDRRVVHEALHSTPEKKIQRG